MARAIQVESTGGEHLGFSDRPTGRSCLWGEGHRQHIAALRAAVRQARELGRDRVFAYTPREAKAALRHAIEMAAQHECAVTDPRSGHGRIECAARVSIETHPVRTWADGRQTSVAS
jgi:hypothetical protein